jgi:hypothetical protein
VIEGDASSARCTASLRDRGRLSASAANTGSVADNAKTSGSARETTARTLRPPKRAVRVERENDIRTPTACANGPPPRRRQDRCCRSSNLEGAVLDV